MTAMLEHAIAQEAGAWLFRLREDHSAECRKEFSAWLQTSPQHVAEFLLISATDVEIGTVDAERRFDIESLLAECKPNILELPNTAHQSPPAAGRAVLSKMPRWRQPIAMAAALTGVFVLGGLLWQNGSFDSPNYRTDIGEQRSIKLTDGSVVQLNTRSHVEIRFSQSSRTVHLLEGEALFTVARDSSRPFVVYTGSATVQAVGTQFNIYRRAAASTVSVVEGRVKIESQKHSGKLQPASQPLLLNAGQQAAIETSGRVVQAAAPQIDLALAWRQRHLEFRSATVAEVAAEFNRYNALQIRIKDNAIANRRMSGLFDADEPRSLLDFLANEGGIRFEEGDGTVTLHAADL